MEGRRRRIALTIGFFGLLGCGPSLPTPDDQGEPAIFPNQPLPPIDLDAWCDDPGALPPFADRGPMTRLEQQSPCGHLLTWYYDGESVSWTLWHPDGNVEALDSVPRVESDVFSPTGRLLAWVEGDYEDPTQRLVIRDMQTGESRVIETQGPAHYGFVRLPDAERGASLWLCHAGVLELVDLDDSRLLAEDSRCESVHGGELSTRLIYVDLEGVLSVVDTRDGTRWATAISDADSVMLSPDGRIALESDGEPGRVVDLDRGEVVTTCEHVRMEQALASDVPVFVVCDDVLNVWRDDALVPIVDEVEPSSLSPTPDGSATFRRRLDDDESQIWFAPAEDPTSAQLVAAFPQTGQYLQRSSNGQHGYIVVETSACADVECSETITEVWMWSPAGLGATMLAAGDWDRLHVFDDGHVLGFGSPIEGPLPEGSEIPEPQLVLVGPDGVPAKTWSIDGETGHVSAELDDGRLLLRTYYGLGDYELVFDREAPVLETLLGPVELAGQHRWDPRLRLVAFLVRGTGPDHLYWGAVPD